MSSLSLTPDCLLVHLVPGGADSGHNASFVTVNSGECWVHIIRAAFLPTLQEFAASREADLGSRVPQPGCWPGNGPLHRVSK